MATPNHDRNGTLGSHALACVAAGLCALPAVRRGDEKRVALRSWKPYQSRLPSSEELGSWFGDETGAMCLVCGAVSGNLEMIDFDLDGEAFEAWRLAVEAASPGLVDRLVIESTPSGGKHVVYRCEAPVSGNTKLAQRSFEADGPDPLTVGSKTHIPRRDAQGQWSVVVTMIETRGEGGLFLCAPSEGYAILHGDLCEPPLITADDRDVLLGCAWSLDEIVSPVVGETASVDTLRPGDDFNERGDPRDVLLRHGWSLAKAADSGGNEHWRRPGKPAGTSATLKARVFYIFSSNASPFEPHKGYSPFAVYALLEHHGDFTAAASALAAQGFGQADRTQGVDLSAFIAPTPAATSPLRPSPLLVGELVDAHPQLRPPVIHGLLREGETMNIIASPKTGKALAIDTPILTDVGWRTMGDLHPGMRVHAVDGSLTTIVAVSEVMHGRPCRRVTTKSGGSLVADENHLWSVVSRRTTRVVSTRELDGGHRGRRWKLPVAAAIERPRVDLPVDPWVLGYWLGNGTTTCGAITVAAQDLQFVQDHLARAGYAWGTIRTKRGAVTFTVLGLQTELRALGVLGNKHVPEAYLLAARWQRQMLAAGLIDSDGHGQTRRNGSGAVEYCTISSTLAEDVRFLLRSLGHKLCCQTGRAMLRGKDCGQKFRLCFAASREESPFESPRKTGCLPTRALARRCHVDAVARVEHLPSVPVRCIEVDHPSGTFLAGRDLTVTHNSWLTLDLAIAVATGRAWLGRYETAPGEVLIIDNELHRETSAHRIPQVARARGVAMREIRERIAVDNLRGRLQDIFTLAPYFEALEPGRYKVIVLDAFYRFMPAGGDENDNGTMANIYNRLDAFADRLRCCFVLIHHSTKGSQSGKSVTDVGAGAGAQSRATDTHVVLRPHEESGVVVLDAAVRSWAPIEPTCLRWSFPVWTVEDGLDPAALKPDRPTKRKETTQPPEPKEPEWSVERFAEAFMNEPRTRDEVVNAARACGLSDRAARRLTALAVSERLVEQEPFNGRSAPRLIPSTASRDVGGDL